MSIMITKNGVFYPLSGAKVKSSDNWQTVKFSDKLFFNGSWHMVNDNPRRAQVTVASLPTGVTQIPVLAGIYTEMTPGVFVHDGNPQYRLVRIYNLVDRVDTEGGHTATWSTYYQFVIVIGSDIMLISGNPPYYYVTTCLGPSYGAGQNMAPWDLYPYEYGSPPAPEAFAFGSVFKCQSYFNDGEQHSTDYLYQDGLLDILITNANANQEE